MHQSSRAHAFFTSPIDSDDLHLSLQNQQDSWAYVVNFRSSLPRNQSWDNTADGYAKAVGSRHRSPAGCR